jgi:hypothetical protein
MEVIRMSQKTLVLGAVAVFMAAAAFAASAQVTLTAMDIEYCLKDTHTKWRIANNTGTTIECEAEVAYGIIAWSGTVGPEHTLAARFTNPFYFYIPYKHQVTVILRWRYPGDTQWRGSTQKSSTPAVLPPRDPPTITCPGDITVVRDPGRDGAIVTWQVQYSADACTCNPPSGSFFPIGTTTVTCTATNYSPIGTICQQVTCSFKVTVLKPTLRVIAEDKVKKYDGNPFTDFTVRYEGFLPGEGPADLGGALVFSGSAVGAVDEGVYEIIPGGLTSSNYDIVFVPGGLTILPYYAIGPAGGAGAFVDKAVAGGAGEYQGAVVEAIYRVGDPIVVSAEVLDFYGRPVTGSCGWVTLIQIIEGGHQIVWYYSTMNYNSDTGLQEVSIPTVPADGKPKWYPSTGLPVGYYRVRIDFKDGSHEEILIQLVTE